MDWIWEMNTIDEGRFTRAQKEKPVSVDDQVGKGHFEGSHGSYTCTLSHCDCQDFTMRLKGQQPCKHILALGIALGAYDPAAVQRMFDGQRAINTLSRAYGRYYLFHAPVMEDAEYDALKRKWSDLLPSD